jgi:hypothetical protein
MRARRGARRTIGRGRYLAAVAAVAGVAVAATACEADTDVPVICQVLGAQTQPLHTEVMPDEVYDGQFAQFTITPKLVTGVPAADTARVVGLDFVYPFPAQVEQAWATVEQGGNILGRAYVENRTVRVRYAGGTAAVADATMPAVRIQASLRRGMAGTDLVWRAPSRIEVMVEWHGTLGLDICEPADPGFGLISVPIRPYTPPTYPPGSWGTFPPGSYPPGSFPGPVGVEVTPVSRIDAPPSAPPPVEATSTTTHAGHGGAEPPG